MGKPLSPGGCLQQIRWGHGIFPNQCPGEDGCGQLLAPLGRRGLLIIQKRLIDELRINFRHVSVFAITRHVVIYPVMYEIKEKKSTSAVA